MNHREKLKGITGVAGSEESIHVDNLLRVWAQATAHEQAEGRAAYAKYHRLCADSADKHRFPVKIACAVFAALSPNNDYHGNLRDMDNLLAARRANKTLMDFKVSTYGQNKRKAWHLTLGIDPLTLIRADKTRNFFLNVHDPNDPQPVTIDGHMFNIWNGKRTPLVGLRGLNSNYHRIANDVRAAAREAGLLPNQMQAVLWLTWRRLHGIKTTAQLSIWDEDFLAARLGWHHHKPHKNK